MNRYANKRHRGPTHRGFSIRNYEMEGNIPVVSAWKFNNKSLEVDLYHIRAFYLHPTKGWRSTGPEGRR